MRHLLIILVTVLGLAGASSASAATLDVTTTGDPDGGHCPASPALGPCSIRAALAQNDADLGGDVIRIPPGTYFPATGLQPHHGVTIEGTGSPADTVLDADGGSSVFDIEIAKGGADQAVTLAHLTLRDTDGGAAVDAKFARPLVLDDDVLADDTSPNANGGGLDLLAGTDARILDTRFSGDAAGAGGAIATSGTTTDVNTLDIADSEFSGNLARNPAGPGGGAILAGFGDVTIRRTRFTDNVAPVGGALANLDATNASGLQPTIAMSDSLLDHNQASVSGGAISLTTGRVGSLIADNLTLLDDSAASGTEVAGSAHAVLLRNTVLAGALGKDCAGSAVLSRGHDVATDHTCGLRGAGDREGVDPRLGPIAADQGFAASALPRTDSPLLDTGDPAGCAQTAQNGRIRPQGAGCDIGAAERPVAAPRATTSGAVGTSARGTVDPGGQTTAVTVEYGPTTTYGNTLRLATVAGWLPRAVAGALPVAAGTHVHFRVVATNASGRSAGRDAQVSRAALETGFPPVHARPVPHPRLTRLRLERGHTRIAWHLTRAATVRFVVRRRHGHRLVFRARFDHRAHAGTGSLRFPRRLLHALTGGRYRLSAAPLRPAGPGGHIGFRMHRPRRR